MESESGAHCQRVASSGPNPASPTVEIGVFASARKSNSMSTACLPCVVPTSGGMSASASTAEAMVMMLLRAVFVALASDCEQPMAARQVSSAAAALR